MRLIYLTDLHGCKWKYNRLYHAVKSFGVKAVINGGDLFPGIDPSDRVDLFPAFLKVISPALILKGFTIPATPATMTSESLIKFLRMSASVILS